MHYQQTATLPASNHHYGLLNTVQDCAAVCEQMTAMLHKSQDVHARGVQLQMLRDCADICHVMVRYLSRESVLAKSLAQYCAYVCEYCASTCLQFPDHESQRGGHICLGCAKECKEFAQF
jgi:hypothetical protein